MTHAGITAGAAYFPSYGVPGKTALRRVRGSDEDAVTMAVEAGERALTAWSGRAPSVGALFVALRRAAEAEGPDAQVVREALGLGDGVRVVTFSGDDDLSGLAAVQSALDAVAAESIGSVLVVASEEAERPNLQAAAAAVIVSASGGNPGEVTGLADLGRKSALTYERWHGIENGGRAPDRRFLGERQRGVVSAAIASRHADRGGGIDGVLFAGVPPRDQAEVHSLLLGRDVVNGQRTGRSADAGIAGPLVAMVEAGRHHPGLRIGLAAYGTGQAALIRLDVPAGIAPSFDWPQETELRSPAPDPAVGPELSLPLESPFFVRNWGASLRLEAAVCAACGHVVFPPSQRPICPACRGRRWRPYPLPRHGTVYSWTENRFLPPRFPSSTVFVLGELSDGFRYWAPAPPEIKGDEVAIGAPVRLALRRFTRREGLAAYGMKFVPAAVTAARAQRSKPERRTEETHGVE